MDSRRYTPQTQIAASKTARVAADQQQALQSDLEFKKNCNEMVGTGRFELPTPRTPSECSTRLSHVPTQWSKFADANRPFRVLISLHQPNPRSRRSILMPAQSHERNLRLELALSIGLSAKGSPSSRRDGVKIAPGKRSAARGKRVNGFPRLVEAV
jgi:hypothetical protein